MLTIPCLSQISQNPTLTQKPNTDIRTKRIRASPRRQHSRGNRLDQISSNRIFHRLPITNRIRIPLSRIVHLCEQRELIFAVFDGKVVVALELEEEACRCVAVTWMILPLVPVFLVGMKRAWWAGLGPLE